MNAQRRLKHSVRKWLGVSQLNNRIIELEATMSKAFDDIKTALGNLQSTVTEVEGELRDLSERVGNSDDPAELAAVSDQMNALSDRLHNAYAASPVQVDTSVPLNAEPAQPTEEPAQPTEEHAAPGSEDLGDVTPEV